MQIKDVTNYIEELAPLAYAEDFDNVGLLIGNYNTKVTGVLVTLDTLEETVDEAIAQNCNLIVSFHPIVFSGLKKINGNNYVERVVLKAIQNNIAIYATHTALDNVNNGVSAKMCEVLSLQNCKILIPKKGIIKKLTTYVPISEAENLRKKLFEAGAGAIGNYDNCSFNIDGKGSYRGNENSNPTVGEKGKVTFTKETAISVTFDSYLEGKILEEPLKDLHTIVMQFFNPAENSMALVAVILYVLSMVAIGFHLSHGFQSGFQSLGLKNEKYKSIIDLSGKAFSIVVPLLFAIIPIYLYVVQVM